MQKFKSDLVVRGGKKLGSPAGGPTNKKGRDFKERKGSWSAKWGGEKRLKDYRPARRKRGQIKKKGIKIGLTNRRADQEAEFGIKRGF